MQQPDNDIAEALVARADDDLSLVRIATAQLDIADAIVGFHAQKAAEKLLKALLSRRRVDYPLTHDVERLVELVEEATGARPPDADAIAALTPWAVEFRYGELADEVLDRDATLDRLQRLRAWAAELLSEPQQ